MTNATLKQIDDSVVLPIPADVLKALSVGPDSEVQYQVCDGQLIVQATGERRAIPVFSLDELLADYDQIPKNEDEDREWLNSPPVGRELI